MSESREKIEKNAVDVPSDSEVAWMVLGSDVLNGERFLLVRDDVYSDEELQERVTDEAREEAPVTYRMTEVNAIIEADLSDERKRQLHELKKSFGSRVLADDHGGEPVPCTEISDWIDSIR